MKTFLEALQEAKDAQKEIENKALKGKDATHGDKADKLDTSINEEADKQKDSENKDLKAKDASHGDKADVLKKDTLSEAANPGAVKQFVKDNASRKAGEAVIMDGKELKNSQVLEASASEILYFVKGSNGFIIYAQDANGDKNTIFMSSASLKNIK